MKSERVPDRYMAGKTQNLQEDIVRTPDRRGQKDFSREFGL